VTNSKGRFSSYFITGTPLESITFGVQGILEPDVTAEATVESPCQDA
jgi:hypothetical protein